MVHSGGCADTSCYAFPPRLRHPSQTKPVSCGTLPLQPADGQTEQRNRWGLSVPSCLGEEGPARAAGRVPWPPKLVLVGGAQVVGAARAWLCLPPVGVSEHAVKSQLICSCLLWHRWYVFTCSHLCVQPVRLSLEVRIQAELVSALWMEEQNKSSNAGSLSNNLERG